MLRARLAFLLKTVRVIPIGSVYGTFSKLDYTPHLTYVSGTVATERIHGKTTDQSQKTKKGFLAFMEGLLRELPSAEEYHVILDNHAIHKRHEVWLLGTLATPYPHLEHENVFFHYTPIALPLNLSVVT